jgi:hypothetical protein
MKPLRGGIVPHLAFIKKSLEKGIRTFYVVAAGKFNVTLAKSFADTIERNFGLKKFSAKSTTQFLENKKQKCIYACLK